MTAIACLRILFNADADNGAMGVPKDQAQAVADAFLKTRWTAPRKCGAVAPLAFVLADNRVETLDPTEMQALATELEQVLFPGRKSGQICLMTFEGDETTVLKFASLSQKDLAGLIAGDGYGGAAGRVHVITAEGVRSVPSTHAEAAALKAAEAETPVAIEPAPPAKAEAPAAPPVQVAPPAAPKVAVAPPAPQAKAPPPPPPPSEIGWWGVHDPQAGVFVGSVLGLRADQSRPPPEEDSKLLTRDLTGLNDAQATFKKAAFGDLYIPFGFWNLTTPSSQEAYKRRLSRYPLDMQARLGATVYGTPREASLGLVGQIRTFLKPSFAFLDLNVVDPTFPVHNLPPELIDSVTLTLSDEDERQRLNAIVKFIERQGTYRGKGFAQGVTGVRSANELEACRQGGITRVSGPAITGFLDDPVAQVEGEPQAAARDAA